MAMATRSESRGEVFGRRSASVLRLRGHQVTVTIPLPSFSFESANRRKRGRW